MCVGGGKEHRIYKNATVICLLMTLGLCREQWTISMIALDLHITMNLGLSSLVIREEIEHL